MSHELFAYFAGSLLLFALSSKGLFIAVSIIAFLAAGLVWWGCGVFGKLWYVKFTRRPLHWVLSAFASIGTAFFIFLIAASAYAPQMSMISALIWRAELTFDGAWQAKVFERTYNAVKEAGFEDVSNFPPPSEGRIPTTNDKSIETSAKVTAEEAHKHFMDHRPLLSRVFWSDPSPGAKKVFEHTKRHFTGQGGQSAGESSQAILVDIAQSVPAWEAFLEELNHNARSDGLLSWAFEGVGLSSGVLETMPLVDAALKEIEEKEAAEAHAIAQRAVTGEKEKGGTSYLAMDYAILANEILLEANEKANRIRKVLILSLVGIWILLMALPFGMIGVAARREADLSRHQPTRY